MNETHDPLAPVVSAYATLRERQAGRADRVPGHRTPEPTSRNRHDASADVIVREVREYELPEIGAITAAAYNGLAPHDYVELVRDARSRWKAHATTMLAAFDDGSDSVLGSVVYATSDSEWSDMAQDEEESEVRLLAVASPARGRGVGEALMRACVARAQADRCARLVLGTLPEMHAAQRLYARLGFRRHETRDWSPRPGVTLYFFALDLEPRRE